MFSLMFLLFVNISLHLKHLFINIFFSLIFSIYLNIFVGKDSILRTNRCYDDISQEVGLCLISDRCPYDCQTIEYSHRTKIKKLITSLEEISGNVRNSEEKKVLIKIRLDERKGDTFVTHVPLMSFGQLMAYFCAFLVIFSGISILGKDLNFNIFLVN